MYVLQDITKETASRELEENYPWDSKKESTGLLLKTPRQGKPYLNY